MDQINNKYDRLIKVSDPDEVNRRANEYYNKPVFLSNRKNKKYMIEDDNEKLIHFGDIRYFDFTKHNDDKRRIKYKKRMMGIKGKWRTNEYSPNWLSLRLLW